MTTAALAPLPVEPAAVLDDEFTGLYRQFHPQLYRYVTHHFGARDADEITQESLARALRSLDRRRTDAETWAWLVRVARNVAYDLARARRVCEATDDGAVLAIDVPDDHVLPEPAALLDERRRIVRSALRMLSPTQRRVLVLYEVDELTCPTIAGLVGSTEDAVRKTLQRARRRFATEIRTIGGGVCGSAVGLFRRGLRRKVRSLSGVSVSSAACVLAGTFALTVVAHPAVPVLHPNLDHRIAVATGDTSDARDVALSGARAAATAAAGRGVSTGGHSVRPNGPGSEPMVRIPHNPLSRNQHWTLVDEEVDVPVWGAVPVKVEVERNEYAGPVCEALSQVGCE